MAEWREKLATCERRDKQRQQHAASGRSSLKLRASAREARRRRSRSWHGSSQRSLGFAQHLQLPPHHE